MPTIAENFKATTESQVKIDTKANVTTQVAEWNTRLKAAYIAAFAEWQQRFTAQLTKEAPPVVPHAYIVIETNGWANPLESPTLYVCEPLVPAPVNISHFSDSAHIGIHIGGPYWQALDKLPDNEVPFPGKADDGTTGFWMRRTRFGNLGYYEKVA